MYKNVSIFTHFDNFLTIFTKFYHILPNFTKFCQLLSILSDLETLEIRDIFGTFWDILHTLFFWMFFAFCVTKVDRIPHPNWILTRVFSDKIWWFFRHEMLWQFVTKLLFILHNFCPIYTFCHFRETHPVRGCRGGTKSIVCPVRV